MKTPQIICIVGTHGVGKTTLSFKLAAHYKSLGFNVKIIQEVARSCPFPINEGNRKTCLWIYHEHSKKELEAMRDHDIVITDRSSYDSFIYAQHFNIPIDDTLRESALKHLAGFYDKIIYVRPNCAPIADGIRSTDVYFQKSIDKLFLETLSSLKEIIPIDIASSQIFDKEESWKINCL